MRHSVHSGTNGTTEPVTLLRHGFGRNRRLRRKCDRISMCEEEGCMDRSLQVVEVAHIFSLLALEVLQIA